MERKTISMYKNKSFKIILVSTFVLLNLIVFQNCSNNMTPMDLDEQASNGGGSSVESLAVGIITNRCTQCHSPIVARGGIDYITDVAQLKYFRVAIPGQAAVSPIYTVLSSSDVHSSLLKPSEVQLIYNWVQTGMEATLPGQAPTIVALGPTYRSIYRNILASKCNSCHTGGNIPRGNLNFSSYSALMNGPGVVNPGNAAGSLLLQSVSKRPGDNQFMPQGGQRLSASEIQAITDWIAAGALDN